MMSSVSFSSRINAQPQAYSPNRHAHSLVQFVQQAPAVQFGKSQDRDWVFRLGEGIGNLFNFFFRRK